jgi:hypothetical protein
MTEQRETEARGRVAAAGAKVAEGAVADAAARPLIDEYTNKARELGMPNIEVIGAASHGQTGVLARMGNPHGQRSPRNDSPPASS